MLDMYANCHIDEEELERYSMGAMPEAAIAPFEEHLLICEPCQLRLAQSDAYVSAMRQSSARLRAEPLKRGLSWLRFPRLVPALVIRNPENSEAMPCPVAMSDEACTVTGKSL